MTFTAAEIERLRGICERAEDGPWSVEDADPEGFSQRVEVVGQIKYTGGRITQPIIVDGACEVSAAFIAEARTALPAALDEVDRLWRALTTISMMPHSYGCDARPTATGMEANPIGRCSCPVGLAAAALAGKEGG